MEVSVSESVPLYSAAHVLAGSLRWLVFAVAQGAVISGVAALVPGALRGRAALAGTSFLLWVTTSTLGGLLYEWWESLDLAARSNAVNQAIGGALTDLGVAENVAYVLVPHAIFVPLLYGVMTGLVFYVMWRFAVRGDRRRGG